MLNKCMNNSAKKNYLSVSRAGVEYPLCKCFYLNTLIMRMKGVNEQAGKPHESVFSRTKEVYYV